MNNAAATKPARPYTVFVREVRFASVPRAFPLSSQFCGHMSWARASLAEALESARASCERSFADPGVVAVDIEIIKIVHVCENCAGWGRKQGSGGRYRQCRVCAGAGRERADVHAITVDRVSVAAAAA